MARTQSVDLFTLGCLLVSCRMVMGSGSGTAWPTSVGPKTLARLLTSILVSALWDTLEIKCRVLSKIKVCTSLIVWSFAPKSWKLLVQVNHQTGQCVPVRWGKLTDGLIQQSKAVVIILCLYTETYRFHKLLDNKQPVITESLRDSPAASMKTLLRRKVRSGSGRFLRKSLRTPVMTLMSSTLLREGKVLPRISFSFSSFTWRSWPEIL